MYTVVFECHSLYFVPHKGEMKRNERGKEFWSLISRTSRHELHSRPPLWMGRWLMCAGGSVQSKWAHAWRGHSTLPLTHGLLLQPTRRSLFPACAFCLPFIAASRCWETVTQGTRGSPVNQILISAKAVSFGTTYLGPVLKKSEGKWDMNSHGIEATTKDKRIWLLGNWQVKAEPVGEDAATWWAGAAALDASVSETDLSSSKYWY